ncbi:MAG: hypothetical protein HDT48_00615, partial [Ruminococcaceae bacterium]|nr:hypothetical protein [Oscillospiraceae bacterium]
FNRIKEAAEKSRNEGIMQFVMGKERNECKWEDRIGFMEDTQVPYLVEKDFRKTLGYLYFWLAHELCSRSQFEKGIGYYKKVLETLKKNEVYYAAALGAVYIEERKLREGVMPRFLETSGEELMYNDGKLYMIGKPGYSFGGDDCRGAVFYCSSLCDSVIFDENLKEGESFTASDNSGKVTCKGSGFTVETPSGKYENCICYVFEGYKAGVFRCETYFRPKIGIVKQIYDQNNVITEWQLSKCEIKGGEKIVPFAEGNRWEYCFVQEDVIYDMETVYEVVYAENGKAILSHHRYAKILGYNENTWRGNMLKARYTYYTTDDTGEFLSDVRPSFEKAEKLAKTKRERLHTSIAKNVMDRIFDTDLTANPDCTEVGYRNFFDVYHCRIIDEKIILPSNVFYSFEWKEFDSSDEFNKIVYDYFYDDLSEIAGTVWSDKWVPGYKELKEKTVDGKEITEFSLEVFPEETVKTAAGEFTGCRHIRLYESRRKEWGGYMNGVRDFWFAPEIGIVKYSRRFKDDPPLEAVWELTEYKGRGEGYFPVTDGLFRRYEPQGLKDGWHSWVEYTFDEDESGVVIFRNTLGTRDREKIS